MHLHDRHGAHHTLQMPLKQARQSLARRLAGKASAAFPYSARSEVDSLGFTAVFVNISLRYVTNNFLFRDFCGTSAN
jgi:hypothetical protein